MSTKISAREYTDKKYRLLMEKGQTPEQAEVTMKALGYEVNDVTEYKEEKCKSVFEDIFVKISSMPLETGGKSAELLSEWFKVRQRIRSGKIGPSDWAKPLSDLSQELKDILKQFAEGEKKKEKESPGPSEASAKHLEWWRKNILPGLYFPNISEPSVSYMGYVSEHAASEAPGAISKPLSKEELMIPRIEVIGDRLFMKKGTIITAEYPNHLKEAAFGIDTTEYGGHYMPLSVVGGSYKLLPWYAHRKEEEMPRFIKVDDEVIEIFQWAYIDRLLYSAKHEQPDMVHGFMEIAPRAQPATEEEYNAYLATIPKKEGAAGPVDSTKDPLGIRAFAEWLSTRNLKDGTPYIALSVKFMEETNSTSKKESAGPVAGAKEEDSKIGVGGGSGNLYVHGNRESIKMVQSKLLRLEKAEIELEYLKLSDLLLTRKFARWIDGIMISDPVLYNKHNYEGLFNYWLHLKDK